jgi:hypothetical protein
LFTGPQATHPLKLAQNRKRPKGKVRSAKLSLVEYHIPGSHVRRLKAQWPKLHIGKCCVCRVEEIPSMNRRAFVTALTVLAAAPLIFTTGCAVTKTQVTAWGTDIDAAVTTILSALGDAALAATIKGYLAQFNIAVANWNGSSFSAAVVSASQDLEIGLGDTGLPPTLIAVADVAINVLDTLITQLGGVTTTTAVGALAARTATRSNAVRFTPRVAYKSRSAAVAAFNKAALSAGLNPIK